MVEDVVDKSSRQGRTMSEKESFEFDQLKAWFEVKDFSTLQQLLLYTWNNC